MYTFFKADFMSVRQLAFKLRYEVYCSEKGWLEPSHYPDLLEHDVEDERSSILLALNEDNQAVGTVRLIINDGSRHWPLPIVGHPSVNGNLATEKCVEISRFTIAAKYRRGDVYLGLVRLLFRHIVEHYGHYNFLFFSVEKKFLKVLNMLGFEFTPFSDTAQWYGDPLIPTRQPISTLDCSVKRNNPEFYAWLWRDAGTMADNENHTVFWRAGRPAAAKLSNQSRQTSRYRKIALINPPLDEGTVKCIDDGFWQPLNLLTLASYFRVTGYQGEIKILDQAVMSRAEILLELESFQPDLAGISPNVDSYNQALAIAQKAKQAGADVVMGGAYATNLAHNILANRNFIDFIITYDGERAFSELITGKKPEVIGNLVYRRNGEVVFNDVQFIDRANLCDIDYSLIDMRRYFDNYSHSINPGAYQRPVAVLTQRGCVWREKTNGCLFCSRMNPQAVFDRHDDIWRRVGGLKDKYGIDALLDVGDDFLGNPDWFHGFYRSRPASLRDIGLRFIYSRVEHIDDVTADKLLDLNTAEICLGLESGDQHILQQVRKGNSPEQHLRAVKHLAERNIKVISAFMIGHPAESSTSLDRTAEHISKILEFGNTNELVISLFTPLPGSQAYNMLLQKSPGIASQFQHADIFPVREFQQEWVRHFCETDFDTILGYANKLENLHKDTYIEFK